MFLQELQQDLQYSHMQSSHPMLGNYSTYRINSCGRITRILQEILQLQGLSHPMHVLYQHPPATVPMHPSILHSRIRLLGPYGTPRLPVNSTHRNSILGGRQHPHTPYKIPQVHSYRILQGE